MAKDPIGVGTDANDNTGDPIRNAFIKVNSNEDELYEGANITATAPLAKASVADTSVTLSIADNGIGATQLNVSGNGSDGQILKSDGDGSFSWIANDQGDITGVAAGAGLTGGGTAGDVTLTVGAGTGITVGADSISLTAGGITSTQLGANSATPAKVSLFDDNAAATDTHILVADGTDFINKAVSGDATLANTGALTIANDIITHAKLGAEFTTTGAVTTALDFGANQVFTKTMSGDTTFTYSNVGIGMVKDFILTGSFVPTFPSGTKTVAGTYDGSVSNLIQIVAIASGDYWMSISKAQ